MPELTDTQIAARAAEDTRVHQVRADYARLNDSQGHMRANLQRMENEGTTGEPALDQKHPDNQGKTQYEIDQAILADITSRKETLETLDPELFTSPKE